MQNKEYDHSLLESSAYIGLGRIESQSLSSLSLGQCGGEGVLWPVMVDGEQLWIWCDERRWCDWVAPVVSVSDVDEIPPDLRQLVAKWASSQFCSFPGINLDWGVPVKGCVRTGWTPVLRFRANDQQCDCCLIDWPLITIQSMTRDWMQSEIESNTEHLSCNVSLQIGSISTTLQKMRNWREGDGVVLAQVSQIEQSKLWLCVGDVCVVAAWQETGEFVVENKVINESELQSQNSDGLLDTVPFTISVEVGRVSLPLTKLLNLQPGDCLFGQPQFDQHVSLMVQGVKIGTGDLIKIDERLVVRIAEISQCVSIK